VTYLKARLKIAEIIFDGQDVGGRDTQNIDIVRYKCRALPVPGSVYAESYSLWANLGADPDYLLAKMSRVTRSQIRRAQTEGIRYEFTSAPNSTWTDQFFDFYELFAVSRKLRSVNRCRFLAILGQNALDFSRVSSPDGRILVWHANLRIGRYVLVDASASLFRREIGPAAAYIGRANRLLHWLDMLRFSAEGFAIYDFGGWYGGTTNEQLLRINRFKESFGGELVLYYNCDQAVSWKGALALSLRYSFLQNPLFKTSGSSKSAT
jgi:hypothetical protein